MITYDKLEHSDLLKSWGVDDEMLSQLPSLGLIVADNDGPIAAGFIRRVENNDYGMIEGFIANPKSSGKRRYKALNKLADALIQISQNLGIPKLIAFTSESSILKRSEKHGFKKLPVTMIGMQIKE